MAACIPLAFLLLGSSCPPDKPTLVSLNPTSGPPGTTVQVDGSDLSLSSVIWDAGLPAEKSVPQAFLSATVFTVPLDAAIGPHPVKVKGKNYSDQAITFQVTAGNRPGPRLDDVTLSLANIAAGSASFILMAHGANIDVGAKIRIGGVAQETYFSRVLINQNLEAADPSTLGYPIFHYATVWCIPQAQIPNSDISVTVENLNGTVSNAVAYHIAASNDELDSDGDGLLDSWETSGYDANGDGTIDVDLPTMGADPLHKDLFVEVDSMSGAGPVNGIWAIIEAAFANAPVLNSDGNPGIAIHLDRGQLGGGGDAIPFADRIRYDNSAPNAAFTYTNFHTQKQNHFNQNRLRVFRYCIFAWDNGYFPGASGQAEGIPANDFFVSLGGWGAAWAKDRDTQLATFMHELGHTLNLRHGGDINTNYKPNYNSIMTYGGGADWDPVNGRCNRRFVTPSQTGGLDLDGNLANTHGVYSYSQGMRASLDENALNEGNGVCDGVHIDWDSDGNNAETGVSRDINCDNARQVLQDYGDWANIEANFRVAGSEWGNN
jgi:hypothetical protein